MFELCRVRDSPSSACRPAESHKTPLRRGGFLSVELPSARMADIRLIYSGSYCGSRTGRTTPKSETPPARRRGRSLYKFHESFEPYIFSLSSRFARHVLLKYDNFTRAGRPPLSPPSPPLLGACAFLFSSTVRRRDPHLLLFTVAPRARCAISTSRGSLYFSPVQSIILDIIAC